MNSKMSRLTHDDYRQLALELSQGELAIDGLLRLRVNGDSMAPFLQPGDSVLVAAVAPALIERGDLILLRRAGEVVTHRVVAKSRDSWRTKGDNRHQLDPAIGCQEILGRVVAIERGSEIVPLRKGRRRTTKRVMGLIGLVEGRLWQVGAAAKVRFDGLQGEQGWRWGRRFIVGPIVVLKRLISLVAGWSR
jgi:signal peptidase I